MQKPNIWRSQYISLRKVIVAVLLFSASATYCYAQGENMNNTGFDTKKYYFGITFGFNSSSYKITHDEWFIDNDSIQEVTPLWRPGLQLGLMANVRLSNFIDFRTIPSFVLREKAVRFRQYDRNINDHKDTLSAAESVLFHWPFEFKFKSDRQNNFRFYAILGGKVDYDFNSAVSKRKVGELLAVKPFDVGANAGLGFEFYFPNFILAPEIKFSQGLINIIDKTDTKQPTALAIERLNTRMIILSLHIQG